jgi:hypothetical protein
MGGAALLCLIRAHPKISDRSPLENAMSIDEPQAHASANR